jgi:DNA-binding response OmpR family regulator
LTDRLLGLSRAAPAQPEILDSSPEARRPRLERSKGVSRRHARETVLVVQDEEAMREVNRRILSREGYEVLAAASGPEALAVAERHELARRVWRDGVEVELTLTEFDLLRTLAESPERVVSRRELMQRVWDRDLADSGTIDAHIYRLRRRIEPDGSAPMYVHNVPRVGYRFATHLLRPA